MLYTRDDTEMKATMRSIYKKSAAIKQDFQLRFIELVSRKRTTTGNIRYSLGHMGGECVCVGIIIFKANKG